MSPTGGHKQFAPVFTTAPMRMRASVNAGDHRLYLGGGHINKSFCKALKHENESSTERYNSY